MATQKSFLCILVLFLSLFSTTVDAFPEKLSFDYIFQFGDSLSDTGNLITENPIGAHTPFGNFPYGITLKKPTGCCSDGLLMIDYFAKFFHLPLLSPYLDQQGNFSHGVNFAVAGSTALDTAVLRSKGVLSPVTNSSLSVQLNWFKSHLSTICKNISECKSKVRKSLIFMGEVGGNDYNYALLEGKSMEVEEMVPQVIETIKEAVKEVINLEPLESSCQETSPSVACPFILLHSEPRTQLCMTSSSV